MEFGGYLSLELENRGELFLRYPYANIARLNCGRNAIAAVALSIKPSKLWIPYYNCSVVRDTLDRYGIRYSQYFLNNNLEPLLDKIGNDEFILFVNYFGVISKEILDKVVSKYHRVIFDNTQAFFAEPIFAPDCFNIYSPRKFVGVIDGAYVVWKNDTLIDDNYPLDISWNRASFLFKSAELGINEAYQDNLMSMVPFDDGIKRMSILTKKMLASLDYDRIQNIRNNNFQILHKKLSQINEITVPLHVNAPFIYPLYVEIAGLRKKLVEKKIYVSQWWKYLLEEVPDKSLEAKLSNYLLPIPIDHRYTAEDIEQMAEIIIQCVNKEKKNQEMMDDCK